MKKKKTEIVRARIDETLKLKLIRYAAKKDVPESFVIREALKKFLSSVATN